MRSFPKVFGWALANAITRTGRFCGQKVSKARYAPFREGQVVVRVPLVPGPRYGQAYVTFDLQEMEARVRALIVDPDYPEPPVTDRKGHTPIPPAVQCIVSGLIPDAAAVKDFASHIANWIGS